MKMLLPALLVAVSLNPSLATEPCTAPQATDIVDTAVAAGQFKTLAAALTEAGLVDALKAKDHSLFLLPQMQLLRSFPKALWNHCSRKRTKPSCRRS